MAAACEVTVSNSSPTIGIVLTLIASLFYAFGNCLQRYSLLRREGERVFGLNRHVGWLVGACVYFSSNGFYAAALSFAHLSVLSAVFGLTIIVNAGCSRCSLGDKLPQGACPGYLLVLAGSIMFAFSIHSPVCHFGGDDLVAVLLAPWAIVFWCFCCAMIVGGACFAGSFERSHTLQEREATGKTQAAECIRQHVVDIPGSEANSASARASDDNIDEPIEPRLGEDAQSVKAPSGDDVSPAKISPKANSSPQTLLAARVVYPLALGAVEAVGALILKAFNSLVIVSVDEGQLSESTYGIWATLFVIGTFVFLALVWWLRLVYRRFEISGTFPVEFGMLTFATVVGGFAVFQDYKYIEDTTGWIVISVGGACILIGICIVALASWRAQLR